jgi:phospholipase C
MATRARSLAAIAAVLALTVACAGRDPPSPEPAATTPIRHLVIIYQENISFDHYFGTYPHAANIDGQPFTPNPGNP